MNAGSEYLSSSGSEFAFEEIPLRICGAEGNCVWEIWQGQAGASASQLGAMASPHPGMGFGVLKRCVQCCGGVEHDL